MALTRASENVGGNHAISFEAPFSLRLAGHIDCYFSGVFVCNLLVSAYYSGECSFLPSHSLACGNIFCLVRIHCIVYIINSLLAANCICSWAPYLFDCKPRLIKFFSSFRAAYNQGELTFFILSKSIDDAQSFLGYVLSTKFFFRIRISSASRAVAARPDGLQPPWKM